MKLLPMILAGLLLLIVGHSAAEAPAELVRELEAMLESDQGLRRQIREVEAASGPGSSENEGQMIATGRAALPRTQGLDVSLPAPRWV